MTRRSATLRESKRMNPPRRRRLRRALCGRHKLGQSIFAGLLRQTPLEIRNITLSPSNVTLSTMQSHTKQKATSH